MWKAECRVGVAAEAGGTVAVIAASNESVNTFRECIGKMVMVLGGRHFFEMHFDDQSILVVEVLRLL
jgi:hypothetical protein